MSKSESIYSSVTQISNDINKVSEKLEDSTKSINFINLQAIWKIAFSFFPLIALGSFLGFGYQFHEGFSFQIKQPGNDSSEPEFKSDSFNEANAGKRIALVIGINEYIDFPLNNAIADADAVGKKLQEKGFKLIKCPYNPNKVEMVNCIQSFQNILSAGGVGVFYYAGMGVEVSGVNYLYPSDSSLSKFTDKSNLASKAVNLDKILEPVDDIIQGGIKNNGSAILYATDKGNIAYDGTKHSPFVEALLPLIDNSNYELNELFITLKTDVKRISKGLQIPWISSSLDTEFYFSPSEKEDIGLLKIIFLDTCRNEPLNLLKINKSR